MEAAKALTEFADAATDTFEKIGYLASVAKFQSEQRDLKRLEQQAKRDELGKLKTQVQGQRGIKPDAKQMFKIRQMMERESVEMDERTKIQQSVNGNLD